MIDFFLRVFHLGDYSYDRTFGAPRSSTWPKFKREYEKTHPKICAFCKTTKRIELHHQVPFHIDPSLEEEPSNMIWVCRDHHFYFAHLMDWSSYNKTVLADSELWTEKIAQRP